MPHQSSQLTEDTEVRGEKRKGREDSKGKQGKKDVWGDTESKREVKEIKDIAQQERGGETWKRERADTVTRKYCTKGTLLRLQVT